MFLRGKVWGIPGNIWIKVFLRGEGKGVGDPQEHLDKDVFEGKGVGDPWEHLDKDVFEGKGVGDPQEHLDKDVFEGTDVGDPQEHLDKDVFEGKAEAANLPPLTEAQKNKLRHLSVVTLAAKIKCIPYSVLLEQLQLKNVRQLEDLVIEAVYADVLRGSLDQRNQRLEVDYSIGRDIRREELSTITRTLQEWCQGCEVVLSGIEEQVSRANQHKEQQLALKQQIESEVANLKKTIKVTTAAAAAATSQDPEQHLTELREPAPGTNQRQASKKTSKAKGLRGSAKIWSKSN
ncbi:PREDICTED: COP9 signalosome complex subunit 7a [Tauraco erythrolophus]|uniref:COP9 signalosome complex subunit 7a n=1 Tax=Tauraco erythrolophus TaxID=121530 RepID=UPI0005239B61|nr:PREDICTED: COP9 signalosome complex subunit 7a [Tauraco erythrolophus]